MLCVIFHSLNPKYYCCLLSHFSIFANFLFYVCYDTKYSMVYTKPDNITFKNKLIISNKVPMKQQFIYVTSTSCKSLYFKKSDLTKFSLKFFLGCKNWNFSIISYFCLFHFLNTSANSQTSSLWHLESEKKKLLLLF